MYKRQNLRTGEFKKVVLAPFKSSKGLDEGGFIHELHTLCLLYLSKVERPYGLHGRGFFGTYSCTKV